jgi:hypothetical protein
MAMVRAGKIDRLEGAVRLKATGAVRYRKGKPVWVNTLAFSLINDGDTSAAWIHEVQTEASRAGRISNGA